jgi:coenzyme F420 hydrogenase subunit beta
MATLALPILDTAPLRDAVHRDLCTDCGVSRTSDPHRCGSACQFINPRYDVLERQVHGRERDPAREDELYFGPYRRMLRARMAVSAAGAQWTGITTRIAEQLLERGLVDAVLATASDPQDRWAPRPVLVTRAADMAQCRGMKMGFSPVLALLDEAAARGYTRLAVVGIPCQVHALRALEAELGLERLYVIGTPCSDNTTIERFHQFLSLLDPNPERITYLEFRPDMRVELRFDDGSQRTIAFAMLPMSQLPTDFFPLTCRSCFDYTNSLADITVGYIAGEMEQWLLVRTERGEELLSLLGDTIVTSPLSSRGDRRKPVRAFLTQTRRVLDGLPMQRAPKPLRPLVGWMMSRFRPRGLEFARARVDMKMGEGILTLRRHHPLRMKRMVPDHAWQLAAAYGIRPEPGEQRRAPTQGAMS